MFTEFSSAIIITEFDRHSLPRRDFEPTTIRLKDRHGNYYTNGDPVLSKAYCIHFFNTKKVVFSKWKKNLLKNGAALTNLLYEKCGKLCIEM